MCLTCRAPSQYPKRSLFVRSRKVSKPRDWYFELLYRFEIWQAHRQHCCRSACQISERSDNFKYKSRGFETLRDLTERRLFGYWDGALGIIKAGVLMLYCLVLVITVVYHTIISSQIIHAGSYMAFPWITMFYHKSHGTKDNAGSEADNWLRSEVVI